MDYIFLQHYWWFIISLLAGILVFLMFVQGGQSLLFSVAKTDAEKSIITNIFGHKWELTFTTLVTFGGAFFASFPLFYSTSFGGATYVWFAILIVFVIQAVSYMYRTKPNNFLGTKTYDCFLLINGVLGTLLIGTAIGTFFTGSEFLVDRANIGNILNGSNVISQWKNPLRGLEAIFDYRNIALGLAIFFLSRVLGIQFLYNQVIKSDFVNKLNKTLIISTLLFLITFLTFLISILFSSGWAVDSNGEISIVEYKYLTNLIEMPIVTLFLLLGIISLLWSLFTSIKRQSRNSIWFGGVGTVITVVSLLLVSGWNNTAYYPSTYDIQSSLTIFNSSSSEFTLRTMFYVSLFIPVVLTYITYAWIQMSKPSTPEQINKDDY